MLLYTSLGVENIRWLIYLCLGYVYNYWWYNSYEQFQQNLNKYFFNTPVRDENRPAHPIEGYGLA